MGTYVRLMGVGIVTLTDIRKDTEGKVTELVCRLLSPEESETVKAKATIHWLSADYAVPAVFRLYDRLFTMENLNDMPEDASYDDYLNPDSVQECRGFAEPGLENDVRYQFVRNGYFIRDCHNPEVFNRIVALKDGYKPQ